MLSGADAAQVLRYQSFLLDDAGRLDAWESAIRAVVRPGDIVLDLGAGMGILSLLACRAGAAKVYAVESSHSAELARLVAAGNGLAERIEVLHARSQDVVLETPANVLITDTTETLGLNGQLLSAVIDARARLLTPDARLVPRRLEVRLVPVTAPKAYRYFVDVWGPAARGFDLSALRPFAANNRQPAGIEVKDFLAEPAGVGAIDLAEAQTPAFAGSAQTVATAAGTVHGLGGFFAATLADGVLLTNDPREATVGYARALLPLAEPLAVARGDRLELAVDTYDGLQWRWSIARTPAAGGEPERREQATLHGFPRTLADLLPGRRPAAP